MYGICVIGREVICIKPMYMFVKDWRKEGSFEGICIMKYEINFI